VMLVGSMSVREVIDNQSGFFGMGWHIFTPIGLLAFVIFWISSLAEGERTPFDIPEADSEIVAGYMTEYSGMKFAVFYLANYMTNLAICAVTAGVFLGGGHGPGTTLGGPDASFILRIVSGVLSIVYFILKTFGLFLFMVFIRATLPRLRVDQLMGLAWKFLLPLALVNIFSTGIWIAITQWGSLEGVGYLEGFSTPVRYAIAYVVVGAINVGAFLLVLRLFRGREEEGNYAPSPVPA
jgi:NADH-quinone oxidoreductase subunit H